ncbi:hypothetical protein M758_7G020300 [Ceratodon purpureus]|nr:hypothetical protein M758_7G020300 [Ceratodon purpureus]
MAAGEFGPGGSHSSLSLRFDILVFKNLPHCPRRRFRCSFELGGAKLIRGEHFIFRAVHWIFSRRRLMLCSRFWGLKLTSASSLVLARLQSAGKQKSKVVAMEPQPKVQKLDHHNAKVVQVASQALRVKKLAAEAILPSRGSALAAGYDLSSAYDTKVPARGKALVKTELSIAIPEGTYARVGECLYDGMLVLLKFMSGLSCSSWD